MFEIMNASLLRSASNSANSRSAKSSAPPPGNPSRRLRPVLLLSLGFLAQNMPAQTWQPVDDFQYVGGAAAQNYSLCVTPNGILLAAGFGNIGNLGHALVMGIGDAGNTWSAPLDDFVYGGVTRASYVGGITTDASGNLYAVGCAGVEFLTSRWLVRRSTDNGLTWSTVDDFSL